MSNNVHELIPIKNRGELEQWVNARTLHQFMKVGKDFSTWIKDYIKDFGFIEGRDFSPNLAKSRGGRQAIEYDITLDMAKELAMLQRNEKGRQARQYFIEWEKRGRQLQTMLANNYENAAALFAECLIIEHEGNKWFAAAQLTLLCGRQGTGSGYQARVKRMEQQGKIKKIMNRGRLIWFVKEEFIKDLLLVHRRMLVAAQIVTLLNINH